MTSPADVADQHAQPPLTRRTGRRGDRARYPVEANRRCRRPAPCCARTRRRRTLALIDHPKLGGGQPTGSIGARPGGQPTEVCG